MLSKEEESPLSEGTLELIDSETEEKMKVTMTVKVLKEYDNALKELHKNIDRFCKKYLAAYISVSTEETMEAVIQKGIKTGNWMSR